MEISNRSLAVFIFITIIVSLTATLLSFSRLKGAGMSRHIMAKKHGSGADSGLVHGKKQASTKASYSADWSCSYI